MKMIAITPRLPAALGSIVGLGALVTLSVFGTNFASASSVLGPTNAQRRALARVEVRHLLATAPLPPGARRRSSSNPTYRSVLGHVQGSLGDDDQADVAEFFDVANGAAASTWLNRLRIDDKAHTGSGASSGPGTFNATFVTFSFPATTILRQPQLAYTMITTPSGALEVRVDAGVLWTPRKSPLSQIASDATRMVVVTARSSSSGGTPATSSHVYRRHDIRRIITKINALPATEPGVFHCPVSEGAMTFSFYAAMSTKPYAVVVAESGGCGVVTISQYRADGTLLGTTHVAGGTPFVAYAVRLLDVATPSITILS